MAVATLDGKGDGFLNFPADAALGFGAFAIVGFYGVFGF